MCGFELTKIAIIEVELIRLKARNALANKVSGANAAEEGNMVYAEIEALERELARLKG